MSDALETAAFTLKRALSGLLKWHHGMVRPTMLYLFLIFGIWGLCKRLQTYSKSDKCCFVGYPKSLGIPPPLIPRKIVLPQNGMLLKRIVLTKGEWEDSATRQDNQYLRHQINGKKPWK